MMTADRFTCTEAAPDDLTEEWCRLLAVCEPAYPFQHPAWHATWWRHFGGERTPLLLQVRDRERLVAVAPLMHDGDRLVFAGDPDICDYMDLAVAADAPDAAFGPLVEQLAALPWRELVLWGLPETSRTRQALPPLAEARGWSVEDEFEAVCPRITLPATWEAHVESLSKKDRHELRRKMRRFQEAGANMTVRSLSAPDEVRVGLDDFIRLHTESRHDKREFMTPEMEAFFRDMAVTLAEDHLVRLFFIELNNERVAGLLAFDTGPELLLYNSGYDPAYAHASVGLVSKALTLRAAIEDGKRTYDFMRGAEPYKYDMGAQSFEVRTLTLRRNT
jgi:CelD/BcsL family acetyltransferase involved in cellulose biosynthesis